MPVRADADPAAEAEGVAARAALVIAVDTYLDKGLRQLRAPAGDASTFGEVLGDPDLGGFDVTSLLNGTAHQMRLAIVEFLTDRRPEDVALVYLSCHGLVDVRRRLYFAANDTLKDRLSATGVEAHWLLDQLEECRARRQVVVLDCCFSGAFARGSKGDTDLGLGERLLGEGRGRVVLTASRGTEYSFEGLPIPGAAVPGSVFTNALVAGIRTGAADADSDGYITVDDAYTYAFDEMRVSGAEQTPQRWLYGAEGSILLARNPAAPAPSDVPSSASPLAVRDHSAGSTRRARRTPWSRSGLSAFLGRHRVVAASAVAALGVIVVAFLWAALDRPETGTGNGVLAGTPKSGLFSASGPWSLVIDADTRSDGLKGCLVEVKNTETGKADEYPPTDVGPEQETSLWQVSKGGSFRWTVNDESCQVIPHHGPFEATASPFTPRYVHGDSEAFVPTGDVKVEVIDWLGNSTCTVRLYNVATGSEVDGKEATHESTSVTLDPGPARQAYVSDPSCDIRITP